MDVAGVQDRGITSSFQNDPLLQEIARTTDYPALERLLQLDFFLGVPVYPRSGTEAEMPGEVPFGWVGAPVDNFDDVLAAGTAGAPGGLGVSLTVDLSETGVADRTDLSRVATQDSGVGRADQAAFTFDRSYTVEGVPFRVQVWSAADADAVPATVPLLLLGGVFGSILAALVVAQRIRSRDQERAFAAEQADRARFQRDIVDSVSTPMVVLDADGAIVASNPAWATLRNGRPPRPAEPERRQSGDVHEASLGGRYLEVLGPHLQSGGEQLADEVGRTLAPDDADARGEAEVAVDWSGRRRWFAVHVTPLSSERGGAVVVHEDVTDRKRSHDELEFKASRDALTGLLNRPAVEQEVAAAVERLRASGVGLSLLFIDLDGFKEVNDSYGHATGDAVLRAVARRIQAAVRADDRVGRLGGDEFLAVLQGVGDPDRANMTADRILTLLDEPIHVGDVQLHVRASVGVATADEADDLTASTLVDQADRAMYLAKQHGGAQSQRLG
jgi:diguanylate cyclase (GGDEF)-like protein